MGSAKILIIDFDYENTTRLRGWLEEEGHLPLTARNGESGRELFFSDKPDLVIIEPMLPKLHGFELSQKISREAPGTPIILLSGFYQPGQFRTEELDSFGAAAFLKKPPEREDIIRRIRMLLSSRSESRAKADSSDLPTPETASGPTEPQIDGGGIGRADRPDAPASSGSPPEFEAAVSPDEDPGAGQAPVPFSPGDLESRLTAPLPPPEAEDESAGKGPAPDDASTIDTLLEDAFSDLELEPALIKSRAQKRPVEKPRPPLIETPDDTPPPPADTLRDDDERLPPPSPPAPSAAADPEPETPESFPTRPEAVENSPPKVSVEGETPRGEKTDASNDRYISFTLTAPGDSRPKKFPPRRLAPVAALLLLFPAYFLLKADRGRPDAASAPARQAATKTSSRGEHRTGPAENPALSRISPPEEKTPASRPGGSVAASGEGGGEKAPAEELAPLLPEAKPDLGIPRLLPGKSSLSSSSEDSNPAPDRSETDASGDTVPAPDPEEPGVKRGDLLPIQQVDEPPVLIRRVDPRYPSSALGTRTEGTVLINALISEKGEVIQTAVLRGIKSPHDFNGAAEAAVLEWKFTPPKKNGERVKVWKVIRIAFRDRGSRPPGN